MRKKSRIEKRGRKGRPPGRKIGKRKKKRKIEKT